ncbi:MAG: amino acid adenylation domain-containing protein, partial [Methylococcales bacterium]|nr:amino acid adenylation domain-containing protein [Methylococcales bacterium]
FKDFAHWQRAWLQGEVLAEQIQYWTQKLADVPALELNTDFPRPVNQTFNGAEQAIVLPESLSAGLKQLAVDNDCTLFITLMAAFQILLHRYSDQDQFAVGTPIAGRHYPEVAPLIGFFVNTQAISADFTANPSVSELLQQLKQDSVDAYQYQDLPFDKLVDVLNVPRNMARSPVFQVMFSMQNLGDERVELPNIVVEPYDLDMGIAKFELVLNLVESDDQITGSLQYNTDLFAASTIVNMVEHLQNIVQAMVDNAAGSIGQINMLSESALAALTTDYNATEKQPDAPYTAVHQGFEQQVEKTPDHIATAYQNTKLSYQQLNERANQLAHKLIKDGLNPEQAVAICLPPSTNVLVAILAVLKAGGCYVPIDPNYPQSRIEYILDNAAIKTVLSDQSVIDKLDKTTAWLAIDGLTDIAEFSVENPNLVFTGSELIYQIFTSGSTGKPKGVGVEHAGAVNLLHWYCHEFAFTDTDSTLIISALGFDLTQKNLFALLWCGGCVCFTDTEFYDPEQITQAIELHSVTRINSAPSAFYPLVEPMYWPRMATVKTVFLGGESIQLNQLKPWLAQQSVSLVNTYGPTECTDIAAFYVLTDNELAATGPIPIGLPNDNVQLYVLDQYLNPVPMGVVGELVIAGLGVGRGYLGDAAATAESFIENHITGHGKMYKTGDRVLQNQRGEMLFVGRADHQVKLRGLRIELGEIESVIGQIEGVSECLVLIRDEQIIAYTVGTAEENEINLSVAKQLPDYMVPSHCVALEQFPLTPNGKVDRSKLPNPSALVQAHNFVAPQSHSEQLLASLWGELLKHERIGVNDDFFQLGGHSLLVTRMIALLRERFNVELSVRQVFEKPTIQQLAHELDLALAKVDQVPMPVLERQTLPSNIPLSFAQERLLFLDQLQPGNAVYNMPAAIRLTGKLDIVSLEKSVNFVIKRHDALRTRFATVDSQSVQIIDDYKSQTIPVEDISDQPDYLKEQQLKNITEQYAALSFDLTKGPLLRAKLVMLSEQEHVVMLTMHHIVSDGWSVNVLVQEVSHAYQAYSQQQSPMLPELSVQYVDYAIWQRDWLSDDVLAGMLQFWRETLDGAPEKLTLPTDRPRPDIQTYIGRRYRLQLPDELSQQVKANAQDNGVTLYMYLLAAYQILLSRYAGQETVVVGSPVAGRSHASLEPLIGMFVNVVLMRADLAGNPTLSEFLQLVRTRALAAYGHQDIPIEMIMNDLVKDRSMSYPPLAQVGFTLETSVDTEFELAGLSFEMVESELATAKFDMILSVSEYGEQLNALVEFNTDLFDVETIEVMMQHYQFVLEQMVGNIEQPLNTISLLNEHSLHEVLGLNQEDYLGVYPLTPTQRDLYIHTVVNPETTRNCLGLAVKLQGEFSASVWQRACQMVVDNNPILSARLLRCDQPYAEPVYQCIPKQRSIEFEVIELPAGDASHAQANKMIEAFTYRAYELDKETLIKFYVIAIGDDEYYLLQAAQHIILDGVGMTHVCSEICAQYTALSEGCELPLSATSFFDYVTVAADDVDKIQAIDFWQQQKQTIERLDFPTSTAVSEYQASDLVIEGALFKDIKRFCRKNRMTPTMFFRSLYALSLAVFCRSEDDFVITEVLSGRPRGHLATAGCYYQQMPVLFSKAMFDGSLNLTELFDQVRQLQKMDKKRGHLSVMVQQQLLPAARTTFLYNFYHFAATMPFLGQDQALQQYSPPVAEDQVQMIVKVMDAGWQLNLLSFSDHFEQLDLLERIKFVAQQIVSGTEQVSALNWLTESELAQAQIASQQVVSQLDEYESVDDQFLAHVKRSPNAVALIAGNEQVSYQVLNDRMNEIAHTIMALDSTPEWIGVCCHRSVDMIASIFATLRVGAAYIPLDPDYPEERLSYILADANVSIVLTQARIAKDISFADQQVIIVEEAAVNTTEPVVVDSAQKNALIYAIYTSGSTGKPKGASVYQHSFSNLIAWYADALDMNGSSRSILISSIGFDLTQKNIFANLCHGGSLVLPELSHYEPELVADLILQHQVQSVNCAPSMLYPLAETYSEKLSSLRYAVLGGEAIQMPRLLSWLQQEGCVAQIVNSYGPTECTDVVAAFTVTAPQAYEQASPPIGSAIANVSLYVLNAEQQLVPDGVCGEIVIAGVCVGAGYMGQPELTEQSFISLPFAPSIRAYRTGDLGRRLADGTIEYMGRLDFQVKLRGLRIELGEIEVALSQLESVADTTVLVKHDQLVAYVVSDDFDPAQARQSLLKVLPDYMVPMQYVALSDMPLNAHGKVDRKALPEPGLDRDAIYVAPRNSIEQTVCDVWAEALNIERVGVNDHFFVLGGHSLMATQVVSKLSKQYQVQIPLRTLFESETAGGFAQAIDVVLRTEKTLQAPAITAVSRDVAIPLSFAQERLWFLDQLEPGNVAYSVPAAVKVEGVLQREAFEHAIAAIIMRHEILRTTFSVEPNQPPVQKIHAEMSVPLTVITKDISSDKTIEELVRHEVEKPFDLTQLPLFNVTLVETDDDVHVLIINMHHIISDGWSSHVFIKELGYFYQAVIHNHETSMPPLSIQYGDYAYWQKNWLVGDVLEQQLSYWSEQLADAEILDLPTDRPRQQVMRYRGQTCHDKVELSLVNKLKTIGQNEGATLFMTLLSSLQVLLSRYSGQKDICIGTPVAGRQTDTEALIGMFVNTVVLRGDLTGNPGFSELLRNAREVTLDAFAHQDAPFEKLVDDIQPERRQNVSPLFQVMLVLQNMPEMNMEQGDFTFSPIEADTKTAKFYLTIMINETPDGLVFHWEYNTDLFDQSSIENMVGHYHNLLSGMVADPEQPVSTLPMLSETEWTLMVDQWNETEVVYPSHFAVHQMLEKQVFASPYSPAVTLNNQSLTYTELNSRANQLAHHLQRLGVNGGSNVAICMSPSLEMVISIYAVLKAGAAYVPVDPTYPEKRIGYIIGDSESAILLTQESQLDNIPMSLPCRLLCVDTDWMGISIEPSVNLVSQVGASQPAYIIYTSGSTGKPKMVEVTHRSLSNLIHWYTKTCDLNADDHVLLASSFCFDLSQKNFFATFSVGANLVLLGNGDDLCPSDECAGVFKHWQERINQLDVLDYPALTAERNYRQQHQVAVSAEHALDIKEFCSLNDLFPDDYFKSIYAYLISQYCRPEADFVIHEQLDARALGVVSSSSNNRDCLPTLVPVEKLGQQSGVLELLQYFARYRHDIVSNEPLLEFLQSSVLQSGRLTFHYHFLSVSNDYEFFDAGVVSTQQTLADEDQVLLYIEKDESSLTLNLHYHPRVFSQFQFLEQVVALSEQIIQGGKQLGQLRLMSALQLDDYLNLVSKQQKFESVATLASQFEAAAEAFPSHVAVRYEHNHITYYDLNERANQLARYLVNEGVSCNQLVALYLDRSVDMVVCILAVLKAGAAYLPLDPGAPQDRVSFIVKDAAAVLLITHSNLAAQIQGGIDSVFVLDQEREALLEYDKENLNIAVKPEHLAYVIYTSGSTGKPKGVMINHQNVVRLMAATQAWFKFDEHDVWTLFHSYAFDFSVWEIWGALFYGGSIVVVPYLTAREPNVFYQMLIDQKVTVLNQTPSAFYQLIRAEEYHLNINPDIAQQLQLRQVIFGGEALDLRNLAPWVKRHGDASPELVNMYGITETTVHVTYRRIKIDDVSSAVRGQGMNSIIGLPIPDLQLYVLDENLNPVPEGVPGELCIAGAGLSDGYLERPELTAERFIEHPFADGKLYRSGDLARILESGELEYIRRIDSQVQLRGFRIELGEIESVVGLYPGIRENVAIIREDVEGDQRLVVYLVSDSVVRVEDLRAISEQQLPSYMVPSAFVVMESLPLTANGKVDFKALPKPGEQSKEKHSLQEIAKAKSVLQLISQHNVTILNITPSSFYSMVDEHIVTTAEMAQLASLRCLVLGGEPVYLAKMIPWLEGNANQTQIINTYGPAECADIATAFVIDNPFEYLHHPVPIGKPIANVMVYLLDKGLNPVPPGVVGEIYIGGTGVGAGYPNDAELTANKFIADPFSDQGLLYKTGDLARFLPSGDLMFLGRKGTQVRLKGLRTELSEIEAVLLEQPVVKHAITAIMDDVLIAYVVPESDDWESRKVQGQLKLFLPDYMVPTVFIELERIPLLANGKINRKALPEPNQELTAIANVVMPRNSVEHSLAELWRELLGADVVGVMDNFFELGGHSLLATQMISQIRERFGVELPLRTLFNEPTIAQIALAVEQALKQTQSVGLPAIEQAQDLTQVPLSFSQERLWFIDQLEEGSQAYIIPAVLKISGGVNVEALEQALSYLVERHVSLRTVFHVEDNVPRQILLDNIELPLSVNTEFADSKPSTEAILTWSTDVLKQPFVLDQAPLFRVAVMVADGMSVLVVAMHHIISDGWSMEVFFKEIVTLYTQAIQGQELALMPMPIQYHDFAIWQRAHLQGDVLLAQERYWAKKLHNIAPLQLPTDFPAPKRLGYAGHTLSSQLSSRISTMINETAVKEGVTTFMLFMAAYQVLLYRYSNQEDICVGSPIAGRTKGELEPLIGFFVNTLVVRGKVSCNLTFKDLLLQLKETSLEAFANQDVPFERLVSLLEPERRQDISPLFQVMLVLQNASQQAIGSDQSIAIEPVQFDNPYAKFDITLSIQETEAGFLCDWEYKTGLFEQSTIEQMFSHFEMILFALCEDTNSFVMQTGYGKQELYSTDELCSAMSLAPVDYDEILPLLPSQQETYTNLIIPGATHYRALVVSANTSRAFDYDVLQQVVSDVVAEQVALRIDVKVCDLMGACPVYQCVRTERDVEIQTLSEVEADLLYELPVDQTLAIAIIDNPEGSQLHIALNPVVMDEQAAYELIARLFLQYQQSIDGLPCSRQSSNYAYYVKQIRCNYNTLERDTYWRDAFKSVEPLSFHLPSVTSTGAHKESMIIDFDHAHQIRSYCKQHQMTLKSYFAALFSVIIQNYCQPSADYVIHQVNTERPIGFEHDFARFSCVVPLVFAKSSLSEDVPFESFVRMVQATQKEIIEQSKVTRQFIQTLLPQGQVDFLYQYHHLSKEGDFDNMVLLSGDTQDTLEDNQARLRVVVKGTSIQVDFQCHDSSFVSHDLTERFEALSQQCVTEARMLSELDLTLPEEQTLFQDLIQVTDHTSADMVWQVIDQQCEKTPEAIALQDGACTITYAELQQLSNQMANHLYDLGYARSNIGLCLDYSVDVVIAMLAIMKAGATYVPIDPSYPEDRIAFIVSDACLSVVLSESAHSAKLAEHGVTVDVKSDAWLQQCGACASTLNHVVVQNEIYMIYTSGSTGQPKAAVLYHEGFSHLLAWYTQEFNWTDTDASLVISSIGFDLTQKNFYAALTCGGRVVFPAMTGFDPDVVVNTVAEHHITRLNCAPSVFYALVDAEQSSRLATLQTVFLGGESIQYDRVQSWCAVNSDCRIINTYGPTECTDVVAFYTVDDMPAFKEAPIPIGHAVGDIRLMVVDKFLRQTPVGVAGELAVSGVSVGAGYYNRPVLTADAFVAQPNAEKGFRRVYKTGDLVQYNPQMALEYLGRIDHQVKLHGLRIELPEIEHYLNRIDGVSEAVVLVVQEQLVAYFVGSASMQVKTAELNQQLSSFLPEYMMPAHYMKLDMMPLTANGKIDRKALPALDLVSQKQQYVAPETETQHGLSQIWQEILELDEVGLNDHFFRLGGHSLIAAQMISKVRDQFNVPLPVKAIFDYPTLLTLANYIETLQAGIEAQYDSVITLQASGEETPIFCVHGIGGGVMNFMDLAQAMGSEQPFYGIQAQGFDGQQPPLYVLDEMVERYVADIQRLQPQGPYRLMGYSMGGWLVMQIAAILQATGEDIQSLVILDSLPPKKAEESGDDLLNLWLLDVAILIEEQTGDDWSLEPESLVGLSAEDCVTAVLDDLRRKYPMLAEAEDMQNIIAIHAANHYAMHHASLLEFDGDVALAVASFGVLTADDVASWQDFVSGSVTRYDVAGDHDNMLSDPTFDDLIQILQEIV